jgi:NADH:ubiquinone oxidoreductase subunit C
MLISFDTIINVLPIVRFELYNRECSFLIQTNLLHNILTLLKNHFNYQFKILTCISGIDYPENLYRFQIVYELLSIKYNLRIRIKVPVDELTPMDSIENIFIGAAWWESEIWDMFGVFFFKQIPLIRLLNDYGFQGHPLRKDFPLTGFTELRYNLTKNRVVYEKIELAQEYRTFEFTSPWEIFSKHEKATRKR